MNRFMKNCSTQSTSNCLFWYHGYDYQLYSTIHIKYFILSGTFLSSKLMSSRGTEIRAWIINFIHIKLWDTIISSCLTLVMITLICHCIGWILHPTEIYSISQEICTRFCCALLCCGYAIVHNEFTWSIYPYSSGLLCWHWGNRQIATVPVK